MNANKRPFAVLGIVVAAALCAGAATSRVGGAPAPPGVFAGHAQRHTPRQAGGSVGAGFTLYDASCVVCHGADFAGVGGRPALRGRQTVPDFPTARLLYEYVLRSMPFNQPGSLSAADAYSVTAYLLNVNGLFPDDGVLSADTIDAVQMPGADPIAPPLPGAPDTPQTVTPGSSQGGATVGGGR